MSLKIFYIQHTLSWSNIHFNHRVTLIPSQGSAHLHYLHAYQLKITPDVQVRLPHTVNEEEMAEVTYEVSTL